MSLTGTQNCRRLSLVTFHDIEFDVGNVNSTLSVFDLASTKLYEYSLHFPRDDFEWVAEVAPNFLLTKHGHLLSVLNVSDNKTMTTVGFCGYSYTNWSAVYVPSKGLLLAGVLDVFKYFKIHNLEKCLQT